MELENLSSPHWSSLEQLFKLLPEPQKAFFQKMTHLLEIDSLTVGLEQINPDFSVHLISLEDTENYVNCGAESNVLFCRKVELLLSGDPVVYAESVCPTDAELWKEYLHCGTSSLGRALFSQEDPLPRSPFIYALFSSAYLPTYLRSQYSDIEVPIIARRSYFIKNHQKLWITEWFLPSLSRLFKVIDADNNIS